MNMNAINIDSDTDKGRALDRMDGMKGAAKLDPNFANVSPRTAPDLGSIRITATTTPPATRPTRFHVTPLATRFPPSTSEVALYCLAIFWRFVLAAVLIPSVLTIVFAPFCKTNAFG